MSDQSHEFTVWELEDLDKRLSWSKPGDVLELGVELRVSLAKLQGTVASKTVVGFDARGKSIASHHAGRLRWLLTHDGCFFLFEETSIPERVAKEELAAYLKLPKSAFINKERED